MKEHDRGRTAVSARTRPVPPAITGSAGKTSTKDLLTQILARHGSVVATERSFNNEIGFPHTVLRVQADTDFHGEVITVGIDNAGVMASAAREAGAARVTRLDHRDQVLDVLTAALRGGEVVLFKGANSAMPIPQARPS